jgi:hypothetical protein
MRLAATLALAVIGANGLHAMGESKNPADYPLRFHVFGRNETNFYHYRVQDEAKGDGRADLYEGGSAKGVDFSFDCDHPIRASFGYETYPARWKKPGKQLVVLLPVFGEAGKFFTCTFSTDVKDFAYSRQRNGGLGQESIEDFKAWMTRVDYDPEHGKNMPKRPAATSADAPATPAPSSSPQ